MENAFSFSFGIPESEYTTHIQYVDIFSRAKNSMAFQRIPF